MTEKQYIRAARKAIKLATSVLHTTEALGKFPEIEATTRAMRTRAINELAEHARRLQGKHS